VDTLHNVNPATIKDRGIENQKPGKSLSKLVKVCLSFASCFLNCPRSLGTGFEIPYQVSHSLQLSNSYKADIEHPLSNRKRNHKLVHSLFAWVAGCPTPAWT
jgi:hypothetical protein